MKKAITTLMLALALCFTFAYAQEGEELCTYITEDLGLTAGMQVPDYVPYSDESVNVYTNSGEEVGSIVVVNKTVESVSCATVEDPTYNLYIEDKNTINDIINSSSKVDTLNEKIDNEEIRIEGTSFSTSVMSFFTSIGIEIGSWFS